jgi:hypothetical protein
MTHPRQRRAVVRGATEQEAQEAERHVTGEPRSGSGDDVARRRDDRLSDVRLHRDDAAAELTEAVGAQAVTVGDHVYLSPQAPGPESAAGRRLLVHELTHVVQQRAFGPQLHRFTASERPQIAKDLTAMMAVVEAIVTASSRGGAVNMDSVVQRSGGHTMASAMPGPLRSKDPPGMSMLTLRYLMTRRCGLLDMRHFMQLLYISWVTNMGNSQMAARGATRRGIEHEETAEAASRFGPEDLTSNALGAWTATQLAAMPQRPDLIARIRETLELCGPVDFDALSPASQASLVSFYAAQSGGEPLNQNKTAVALIPAVPELAGADRSFPFALDSDDAKRATVSGPTFAAGAGSLTNNSDIRAFVDVQRDEVLRGLPADVRGSLGKRLLQGWVSDEDLVAFERLFTLADADGKAKLRTAAAGVNLSSFGQRMRLRVLVGGT